MRTSSTERYQSDPHFHHLVDLLYVVVEKAEFTPTEIREAVMLAQTKYEELHIRHLILDSRWPADAAR